MSREVLSGNVDLWEDSRSLIESKGESEFTEAVNAALESVSPEEALLITSRLIEGMSWPQLCERFGMKRTTLQRRYDASVGKFRERLAKEILDD